MENALRYVDALRRAGGVAFEAHVYERGEHGVGLADGRLATLDVGPLLVSWPKSRGW